MGSYYVYIHTVPNGKVYIGITGMSKPEYRWKNGGCGYKQNRHFWAAIQKYGWDNISHKILFSEMSLTDAQNKERELIQLYNSNDPMFGYNNTNGGDYSTQKFNDEVISRLRDSTTNMWKDPNMRNRIVNKLRGHAVSDVTRKRISVAKLGKKMSKPSKLKGIKLTPERIDGMRGHTPWNKGKLALEDPRIAAYAEKLRGRVFTDIQRSRMSTSKLKKYADGYSTIWVHNDDSENLIEVSQMELYLNMGYSLGRLGSKDVYITDGTVTKKVAHSVVDEYLSLGWYLGKDPITTNNVANSHRKYRYEYCGNEFFNCKDVATYLRNNGFPDISPSSVTNIVSGRCVEKYKDLSGVLRRTAL